MALSVLDQTRSSDAAAKNRLEKVAVADKKAPTSNSKTIPEKSPRGSNSTRGGKGNKGGKAGAAGSKDKGGKDKDDGKPKITKARSAYNFYLLKRIAQVTTRSHGQWGSLVDSTVGT